MRLSLYFLLSSLMIFSVACEEEGFKVKEGMQISLEQDNSSNNDTTNPTPAPTPAPTPNLPYYAGQDFEKSLITCATDSKFMDQIDEYLVKPNTPFKAIAVNSQLCGWVSMRNDFSSQEDANRAALEACQVRTGNGSCAVFAEGMKVKYNPTDLGANFRQILPAGINGGNFTVNDLPFVGDYVREFFIQAYVDATGPKAIALALNGAGSFRSQQASQDAARTAAIQGCEALSDGRPCVVLAVDNVFVLDQASIDMLNNQINAQP